MKISIVTPSFNQAKFITQTIESVVTQSGDFEIEYFVMDGGSQDGTVQILKNYEQRFRDGEFANLVKFEWVSQADRGQSDAINQALQKASGEIVGYLNSDDLYEPNALNQITKFFQNCPDAVWATGKCNIINEVDQEICRGITLYKNVWLYFLNYFWLLVLNPISQPATFWKRSLHRQLGYFDEAESLVMDYEFWLRLARGYPIYFLPRPLAKFRWHTHSKGTTKFAEQFEREYLVAWQYARTTHYSLVTSLLHKIHQTLIIACYNILRH